MGRAPDVKRKRSDWPFRLVASELAKRTQIVSDTRIPKL